MITAVETCLRMNCKFTLGKKFILLKNLHSAFFVYFRMDCTLRELTQLIKEVNPDARRRGTVYDFAVGK